MSRTKKVTETPTPTIRAKVRCNAVMNRDGYHMDADYTGHPKVNELWVFNPVTDGEENAAWATATPWGRLELSVDNEAAWGLVEKGYEFYLDLTTVSVEEDDGTETTE